MNFRKLYPKISKYCFVAMMLLVATSIYVSYSLPNYRNSADAECYWTNALIVYVECKETLPFGYFIAKTLSLIYLFSLLTILPVLIVFFPPLLWIPMISFYFFAFSYPISKIRRKFWGGPTKESDDRFFMVTKWLFIILVALSIFLQMRHEIIRNFFR